MLGVPLFLIGAYTQIARFLNKASPTLISQGMNHNR